MRRVTAEIITIGDEILYGQILNTNTQWLSEELTQNGFQVTAHSTVSDKPEAIRAAIDIAFERAEIILITGGLGPTKDDVTKHTLAAYFNCGLEIHERSLQEVTELLRSRGRDVNELNRLQALQPTAAEPITNVIGTAPGMWFNKDEASLIAMPGVPQEMKRMFSGKVLPLLKERYNPEVIEHYYVKTVGIPESNLAQKIEAWEEALPPHIKLAYLPTFGQVKMRLTAQGADRVALKAEMLELVSKLNPMIGDHIYSHLEEELEEVVGRMLLQRGETLSVAESFTGGALSAAIVSVPGASNYFLGGITAYSETQKINLLGVDATILATHSVYSEATAKEMAKGIKALTGSTWALATTGVAGPDDTETGVPAGTVFIALSGPFGEEAKTFNLLRDRTLNIRLGVLYALNLLRKTLLAKQ